MKRSTYIRLIADILIILVILWGPWWLMLTMLIVGILYFPKYYEAFIFGIVIDAVYGTSQSGFFGYNVKYTLLTLVLLAVYLPLRKRFRINS